MFMQTSTPVAGEPVDDRSVDAAQSEASRAIDLARSAEEQVHENDRAWIADLAQRWNVHHRQGLRLRFETGVILNARFGPPTTRQPRGENVLGLVSRETNIDASDLNRMRWFAFRFKDFATFQDSCPETRTWSQVRLLLAEMANKENVAQGAESGAPQDTKTEAELRKVMAGLKALAGLLTQPLPLNEDARDELQFSLRKLSRKLKETCGVEMTISDNTDAVST
jgi:hypothetical protein